MSKQLIINPLGFREYDARWLYEKDISNLGIENLGKGLGTQIIKHTQKKNPRVIVGHDYRSYSEKIKASLKKGLVETGCYVEDIGLSWCLNDMLDIFPNSGEMVFFPGFLPHAALPYFGKSDRIVIAFNIIIKKG